MLDEAKMKATAIVDEARQEAEQVEKAGNDALRIASEAGDDANAARIMNSLALSRYSRVQLVGAILAWSEGREMASKAGDTLLECQDLQRLPLAHFALGDVAELEQSLALDRRLVASALGAIAAVLRAASGLYRNELGTLDSSGRVILSVHAGRLEHELEQWAVDESTGILEFMQHLPGNILEAPGFR